MRVNIHGISGQKFKFSVQKSSTRVAIPLKGMDIPSNNALHSIPFFSDKYLYSGLLSNFDFFPFFKQPENPGLRDSSDADADAVAEAETETEEWGLAAAVATVGTFAFAVPLLSGKCAEPPPVLLRSRVKGVGITRDKLHWAKCMQYMGSHTCVRCLRNTMSQLVWGSRQRSWKS